MRSLESDTTEWLHFHFSLSCIGEGNGNPLQCSCLENPRDGEAWWAAVYGVAQSWPWLKRRSSSSSSSPSLRQGIFLIQESNWGLLHCRRILYQLLSGKQETFSRKALLRPVSEGTLPRFSSRSFKISCLTFISLIQCELTFVCGVRWWSSFIYVSCGCPVCPPPLLKRLSFLHRVFFAALS